MLLGSDSSPTLDAAFDYVEWKNWRSKVNKHFLQLNDRISVLEGRCVDGNIQEATKQLSPVKIRCVDTKTPLRTSKEVTSAKDTESSSSLYTETKGQSKIRSQQTESFAEADYLGIGCLSAFVAVVRFKMHAQIQLILLVISVVLFLWYGQSMLNRAINNEQSEFKPEKKDYSVDYSDSNHFSEYEIPFIYLDYFIILRDTSSESVNRTNLLAQLLKYKNNISEGILFRYNNLSIKYPRVTSSVNITREGVAIGSDFGVYVKLRIQVHESPTKWGWFLVIPVGIDLSPLIGNSSVDHVAFRITRDRYPSELPLMLDWGGIDDGMVDVFMIGYKETVTHKHESHENYSSFDVSWSRTKKTPSYFFAAGNITVQDSWLLLRIEPNSEVEHWGEFVAFTYYDWLTGMGGLFSLMATVFLWTSYGIAQCCGDGISMGILPGLSFNFFSYEEVMWMKNRLSKSGVL